MAEATAQTIRAAVPMLSYENVAAAVDWLTNAFGFRETGQRYTDEDGRVTHAELELDGALVYLEWPGPEYQSPDHHAKECHHARKWLNHPIVIDGVHINAADVEGHRWMFMQAAAN